MTPRDLDDIACTIQTASPAEFAAAQEEAEAAFPPDLCELLSETLPTGDGFPDWRHLPRQAMAAWRARLIADFHFRLGGSDGTLAHLRFGSCSHVAPGREWPMNLEFDGERATTDVVLAMPYSRILEHSYAFEVHDRPIGAERALLRRPAR